MTDIILLKSGHIQKLVLTNDVCHLHSGICIAVSVLSQQKHYYYYYHYYYHLYSVLRNWFLETIFTILNCK